MMVAGLFIPGMDLAVKTAAFTFRAFELQKDMAYPEFLQHVLDLFPERSERAQFLIMYPDVG
jgi:hypothetical protein